MNASNITARGATVTLDGYSGNWWLKRTAPSGDDTCIAGEADFSHALSNLTAGTTYTDQAYSNGSCTTEIAGVSVTFKTLYQLSAGSLTPSLGTLTISGYSGNWWLKRAAPTGDDTCIAGESDHSHALSNLTTGTTYAYQAYSNSSCTDLIALHMFTSPVLAVGSVTARGATLTVGGHSGNWWYKANTGPDSACRTVAPPPNTDTETLTGLSPNTTYTYQAYSDGSCSNQISSGVVTFTTLDLTTSTSLPTLRRSR